jgi:NAD+ synthase
VVSLKYLPTNIDAKGLRAIMKLTPSVLEINYSEVENIIKRFIKGYVEKNEFEGIVLGLSGGVDSCAVAALVSSAIGGEKIIGLILPEKETYNITDINDAKVVANKFDIKVETQDLSKALDIFYNNLSVYDRRDKVSKGNIKARMRMIYLYYYANTFNRIVCGTSDKSENMIGYFTKWGDGAADIAPILSLYKTQVQQLAIQLGIPKRIALKPPSPSLWKNQSAESELGINYEELDLVLYGLERMIPIDEIANNLKIRKAMVSKIKKRWLSTEHKRRLPLTVKI